MNHIIFYPKRRPFYSKKPGVQVWTLASEFSEEYQCQLRQEWLTVANCSSNDWTLSSAFQRFPFCVWLCNPLKYIFSIWNSKVCLNRMVFCLQQVQCLRRTWPSIWTSRSTLCWLTPETELPRPHMYPVPISNCCLTIESVIWNFKRKLVSFEIDFIEVHAYETKKLYTVEDGKRGKFIHFMAITQFQNA